MRWMLRALALSLPLLGSHRIRAEVSEITVAQQYGVSFLPLMVMEKQAWSKSTPQAPGLPT